MPHEKSKPLDLCTYLQHLLSLLYWVKMFGQNIVTCLIALLFEYLPPWRMWRQRYSFFSAAIIMTWYSWCLYQWKISLLVAVIWKRKKITLVCRVQVIDWTSCGNQQRNSWRQRREIFWPTDFFLTAATKWFDARDAAFRPKYYYFEGLFEDCENRIHCTG